MQQPIDPSIIARLSTNVWFGCLTRQALDLALEATDLTGKAIVYFDIDRLKAANERWGKAESSRRIREALACRAEDVILGNWFSGDEFAAIVPTTDALGFARRIQAELQAREMSATFLVWTRRDMDAAEIGLAAIKDRGIRAAIYVM